MARISYIINSLDGGGGALPLADVVEVMRDAGHSVSVIALMERDGRARQRLDAAAIPYEVIGGARRSFVRTAFRLNRLIAAQRPDILWTSLSHATITGQLLGALRRIPVVSWQHNAFLKPANRAILRLTKNLTRHWVSDSLEVIEFASSELGIDRDAISLWPLFIADEAAPVARPWMGGPFRIGSLGRLHRNKGYDTLVRALAVLNARDVGAAERLHVTIGGEGSEQEPLERLAAELGVGNIDFAGFQEQPKRFLASLHGYVQCSHHEGLCIAAHEAMQAGLPLIVTRVGEIQHSVVASRAGALVDFGDVEALADAMQALLMDPTRAAAMGLAAREWVTEHYRREAFRRRGLAVLATASVH